jgi:glycosyltransferase involved in cell wall biosynthesis
MKRLAIISTHPIQYNAPLFREIALCKDFELLVFYTFEFEDEYFDIEFGRTIKWDLPLLEGYNYNFISNGGNRKRDFWNVNNKSIIKDVEEFKPDFILVYGWNYLSHLRVMFYFSNKVKILFRGDSNLLNEKFGIKSTFKKYFLKWVFSKIDHAFAVGSYSRDYFLNYGLTDREVKIVPHAIENERFVVHFGNDHQKADSLRLGLGINKTDKVLLYCGKLVKRKNVELLIRAFKISQVRNLHLLIVGEGDKLNVALKIANNDSKIHFIPFQNQSEIPLLYYICDAVCLPSTIETWGLVVNEGFAAGRPAIVSSKVGCSIDLVKDGITGYIFQNNNIADLSNKINLMFSDENNLITMKSNVLKQASKNNYQVLIEALREIS